MQADEPALDELACRHARGQAVIVGITDDEAGENEKEIHGQIAMIKERDCVCAGSEGQSFENVIRHNEQSRSAPQSVKYLVVRLAVGKNR